MIDMAKRKDNTMVSVYGSHIVKKQEIIREDVSQRFIDNVHFKLVNEGV